MDETKRKQLEAPLILDRQLLAEIMMGLAASSVNDRSGEPYAMLRRFRYNYPNVPVKPMCQWVQSFYVDAQNYNITLPDRALVMWLSATSDPTPSFFSFSFRGSADAQLTLAPADGIPNMYPPQVYCFHTPMFDNCYYIGGMKQFAVMADNNITLTVECYLQDD